MHPAASTLARALASGSARLLNLVFHARVVFFKGITNSTHRVPLMNLDSILAPVFVSLRTVGLDSANCFHMPHGTLRGSADSNQNWFVSKMRLDQVPFLVFAMMTIESSTSESSSESSPRGINAFTQRQKKKINNAPSPTRFFTSTQRKKNKEKNKRAEINGNMRFCV